MLYLYIYLLVFQMLNTYLGFLAPLNPYTLSLLFILFSIKGGINKVNLKLFSILTILIALFITVYSFKFSFFSSFGITAKALQFNYGYLFLIPGLTYFFKLDKKIKIEDVLSATFWTLSAELLLEFVLIRILGVSPDAFSHYPKVSHIRIDSLTGDYVADRLLGLTGNASVMGVFYVSVFSLYLGRLKRLCLEKFTFYMKTVIFVFMCCFFMITSGSAFFAILLSLLLIWSIKKGNLLKNLILGLLAISLVLFLFDYVDSEFNLFNGKFKIEYLLLLLTNDDIEGSLPYLLYEMSIGYNWYDLFIGKYFFEWGNSEAVVKTVDYFYINLVYEFGLLGLAFFFYIIRLAYLKVIDADLIGIDYVRFGFFVLLLGSLHYPAIVYMAPQVFLSAVIAVAIRDSFENQGLKNEVNFAQ